MNRGARLPQRSHLPSRIRSNTEWIEYALCRRVPAEFYPDTADRAAAAEAKRVCAACLVRTACLDYAIRQNEIHGVWGGLAPHERRALKDARRQPKSGATV